MLLPNNTLLQGGKYQIVSHISSGGFGNTYEGVHTMLDTRVAIKEFFPRMFCNRDDNTSHVTVATQGNKALVDKLRKKFIEEAKAIFKMNHPNLVNDRFEMDDELMNMNKGAFLRLYMDEHEVNLEEEIAQRREIEWEDPYTYNCRP